MGDDQRLVVGHQPDHRLPRARPARRRKRVAVFGHSRLGKTVLWASALDERIAAVFSSCAGEMGSALARRDWGETVDDMAQNFPWQFAGNLQKWPGRWNDMPVDAHMLIALSAPRPVFVTGGTTDQWADPEGMFLAEVAAGPVYRLLGTQGSRRHRPAAPGHAGHGRRSRLALSHRRPHRDAGRLDGLPAVPRQVLHVGSGLRLRPRQLARACRLLEAIWKATMKGCTSRGVAWRA